MTKKDYQLYGTKILNLKTKQVGLLICILENKFADRDVDYAIINLDMIPKVVYQDNCRAFRAKYFTDEKGFSELRFNGLYSKLGIETVFARPYNARAKVIERFFKEFQEGFEKLLPSYIGSSIQNKPAYMMLNSNLHNFLLQRYWI